jgi:hypothetical protein
MDVNGTNIAVQFANSTEVLNPELQQLSGDDLLPDVTSNTSHVSSTPANSRPSSLSANSTSATTAATNASDVRPWNISAVDVDDSRKRRHGTNVTEQMLIVHPPTVTTYKFETQQEPNGDAIDIIALSEMYNLGQIESSNATNATASHAHRQALHHHHHGIHHGHNHATQHSRRAAWPTVSSNVLFGVLAVLYGLMGSSVRTVVLVKDSSTVHSSSTATRALY